MALSAHLFSSEVRRLPVKGLEGTSVGPYEIKKLLGVGGMGQVYRANDPRLEREVAIKVLSTALADEPGYLERFIREARAVAKLNHPHIVPVYDFGEQGGLTYLVWPLFPAARFASILPTAISFPSLKRYQLLSKWLA